MIKELTVYEAFDGTRFDSLNEANNYEERLKNEAIKALCNHDYENWEDYIFTRSYEVTENWDIMKSPITFLPYAHIFHHNFMKNEKISNRKKARSSSWIFLSKTLKIIV